MNIKRKSILIAVIFLMLFQLGIARAEENNVKVYVRGSLLDESSPIIREGRTFLPVRDVSEALGGTVKYDGKDRKISIDREGSNIKLWVGKNQAMVDGHEESLDVAPFIKEGKTFVPLRFIGENFREKVEWIVEEQIILVGEYRDFNYSLDSTTYYGEDDSWSMELPRSWKDKVFIEEKDNKIIFHHRASAEKFEKEGYEKTAAFLEISKNNKPITAVRTHEDEYLIKYIDGEYIEAIFTEDFQFFPETQEEYLKIQESAKEALKTFNVYDGEEALKVMGIEIDIPKFWENKYLIQGAEDSVSFYHKSRSSRPGFLFSIEALKGSLWTEEDIFEVPIPKRFLRQEAGWTFVETRPSDVQYDPSNEEDSREYLEMRESIKEMNDNLKINRTKEPIGSKSGNYVEGGAFFEVEIPKNWKIEKSNENNFLWVVKLDGKLIGEIELVEERDRLEKDGMRTRFYVDSNSGRLIRLRIKSDLEGELGSFKLIGDTWTSMDYKRNMEEYLSQGGKKIVGRIRDFSDDGKHIKELKVLKDSGEEVSLVNDYSNIVLLEDGKEPLYGIELLTRELIDETKGFTDRVFEIIVAADGQVKAIWEK